MTEPIGTKTPSKVRFRSSQQTIAVHHFVRSISDLKRHSIAAARKQTAMDTQFNRIDVVEPNRHET
jgi:hypothetical protein